MKETLLLVKELKYLSFSPTFVNENFSKISWLVFSSKDNPTRAYFQFTNGGSISLAQKATAVNQVISDGQELNSSSALQENESGHNIKLLHYNLLPLRGATSLIPGVNLLLSLVHPKSYIEVHENKKNSKHVF